MTPTDGSDIDTSAAAPEFRGIPDDAFMFYEGLRADNSRTYWAANKSTWESAVREPMRALFAALAPEFGTPKLFRPQRDIRFSADKSPYKTSADGLCTPVEGIGYWLSLGADGLTVGGGFRHHDREQVSRYRAAVTAESSGAALAALISRLERHGYQRGGDAVKSRPRGCPPDHPRLDLMRHESLTVHRPLDVDVSTAEALVPIRAEWRRLRPLIEWVVANVGPGNAA